MKLILLVLCLIGIYGILLIGEADGATKLAQYKDYCTQLKQVLTDKITEVDQNKNNSGLTAAQKKACDVFVAALKKVQTAVNTCDPNCSCKGKTPDAGMTCLNNAVKPADDAFRVWNNAVSEGKADGATTLAQYKSSCTQSKQYLTEKITEVDEIKNNSGLTAAQKKACDVLIAALKKVQTAVNTCDPNCSCKGKTPDAGMTCLKNAVKPADDAIQVWNNAMSEGEAYGATTLAQYKGYCTQLKQDLTNKITEVNQIKNNSGLTAAQKKACDVLIAALKKAQPAVNTCDPNCSCKGKTPDVGMNCLTNALKPAYTALNAFDNAMNS